MRTRTQVEWRRRQVFELSSKCHSQLEVGKSLQILRNHLLLRVAHLEIDGLIETHNAFLPL
jgi:hypothetical protein